MFTKSFDAQHSIYVLCHYCHAWESKPKESVQLHQIHNKTMNATNNSLQNPQIVPWCTHGNYLFDAYRRGCVRSVPETHVAYFDFFLRCNISLKTSFHPVPFHTL